MPMIEEHEYLLLVSFGLDHWYSKDIENKDKLAHYIIRVWPSTLQDCFDGGEEVTLQDDDTLEDFCIKVFVRPIPSHVERPLRYPSETEKFQVIYSLAEADQ
jgi:hypothetical protein